MSEVQSVIFQKTHWTRRGAEAWLKQHKLIPKKLVHITTHFFRYRITDPKKYKRFTTIKTHDNIDLIIGYKK